MERQSKIKLHYTKVEGSIVCLSSKEGGQYEFSDTNLKILPIEEEAFVCVPVCRFDVSVTNIVNYCEFSIWRGFGIYEF